MADGERRSQEDSLSLPPSLFASCLATPLLQPLLLLWLSVKGSRSRKEKSRDSLAHPQRDSRTRTDTSQQERSFMCQQWLLRVCMSMRCSCVESVMRANDRRTSIFHSLKEAKKRGREREKTVYELQASAAQLQSPDPLSLLPFSLPWIL